MQKPLERRRYINSWQKRIVETIGLLIFSPIAVLLMGIAVIMIKLEDGGEIFYTQNRIGKGGKEFKVYKLRTMQLNSQQYVFPQLLNDPRVTKVGKVIRPLAIDEAPQLFINMLFRGNMSIFGIRALATEQYKAMINLHETHPEIFSKELIEDWKKAYEIAVPGGLSLSMVKGRSSLLLSYEGLYKKVLYDIEYINKASFTYDLWILTKTLRLYLERKGIW